MSLSQKHPGMVLVPWYDKSEWDLVYNLINSNERTGLEKAYKIISVWKLRTPLLSAGIEGTHHVLKALLTDQYAFSQEEYNYIIAILLMRFLNICLANDQSQGTFTRNVKKHNVPKWLINIRHDIAHGHKFTSRETLLKGINFAFEWVKQNYWEKHKDKIEDYISEIHKVQNSVVEVFYIYMRTIVIVHEQKSFENIDDDLKKKVKDNMPKKFNKLKDQPMILLKFVHEVVQQECQNVDWKVSKFSETIADNLVSCEGLLFDLDLINDGGKKRIPKAIRILWIKLLNVLNDHNLIFAVLTKLYKICADVMNPEQVVLVAFAWIEEILLGIQKSLELYKELKDIKKNHGEDIEPKTCKITLKAVIDKNPEFKDTIDFDNCPVVTSEEAEKFKNFVLKYPTKYCSSFIQNLFLMMEKSPEEAVKTFSRVRNFIHPSPQELAEIKQVSMEVCEHQVETPLLHKQKNEKYVLNESANSKQSGKRWKIIDGSDINEKWALGVFVNNGPGRGPIMSAF